MFDIRTYTTETIPLDSLPQWSPWPARLLGMTDWTTQKRDIQKVDKEYDKEEYLRCLNFVQERKGATPEDVRTFEFRLPRKPLCVSQKNELFVLPAEHLLAVDNAMLAQILGPFMADVHTVVELGCGYGYNLWELRRQFPDKRFVGGEYSANAVRLAGLLYATHPNITVESFNYYDDAYSLLERCPADGKTLVFTRHSIEQLPSAKKFLTSLSQYFDRIAAVVHMEVAYENYGNGLLDLLRKRYVVANDYNRDLVGLLQNHPDIAVLRNEADVYGVSPLNPSSVIAWKPRSA